MRGPTLDRRHGLPAQPSSPHGHSTAPAEWFDNTFKRTQEPSLLPVLFFILAWDNPF
jgi:hypothetical protein